MPSTEPFPILPTVLQFDFFPPFSYISLMLKITHYSTRGLKIFLILKTCPFQHIFCICDPVAVMRVRTLHNVLIRRLIRLTVRPLLGNNHIQFVLFGAFK